MSDTSRLPIATLILIAANIAASFALVIQPEIIFDFGFNPLRPTLQSVFASLFLHANLLHLLGNMLFLAAVGAAVELATGTGRFLIVYFVSGLAGIGLHFLLATKSVSEPHPLVGASGCIAGCAAYYGIRYVGLRVPLAPRLSAPVIGIVGTWFLLQVAGALKAIGDPNASTAYWAHLGGLVAGLLLSVLFRAPDLGHRLLGHKVLDEMNERGPAAALAAALQHLELHPDDPKALQQVVEAHRLMDDEEGEADALMKVLQLMPDEETPAPLKRLHQLGELRRVPPLRRLRLAERLQSTDAALARLLLESVAAEAPSEPQRPEALLSLAGLDWETDRARAEKTLSLLVREHPLHPTLDIARARGWLT